MSDYKPTQPYRDDRTIPRQPDDPTVAELPGKQRANFGPRDLDPPRRAGRSTWPAVLLALGCVVLAGLLVFLLVGHPFPSGKAAASFSGTRTTATPAPSQTIGPATCSAIDEFHQASTPNPNSQHFSLTFPPGTVGMVAGNDAEALSYQHRTLHLCLPLGTTALVDQLSASLLPGGWQPLALTDPLATDGGCQVACWSQAFTVTGGACVSCWG